MKRLLLLFMIALLMLPVAYAGNGHNREKECEGNTFSSSFSYDEKTTKLTMSFEEEDLKKAQPEKVKYFKRRKFFRVSTSFELPKELCEALGTTGPILIKCGNYPLEYKDGTYTITLVSGA